MRVYVDLNAGVGVGQVRLSCLGTLRDLCAMRVRLHDGLPLRLYTDSDFTSDLEMDAVARWIPDENSLDGGSWVAEIDSSKLWEVPVTEPPSVGSWFPCSACGRNLAEQIARLGLPVDARCAGCGVRIRAPIDPPDGI